MEQTANTLNKLVNYLSDENKGKDDEVTKILMINHPFTDELKILLQIPFNFYIESFDDLKLLLNDRNYIIDEGHPYDLFGDYKFIKLQNNSCEFLYISITIFDDENKLRFYKRTDWKDSYLRLETEELPTDIDDLPF